MPFKEDSVAVYRLALADLEPQLLEAVVLRHIAVNKWFPTIAELREGAVMLVLEAEGLPTGPEAWGAVMREVRRVGHWGKPELGPLALQALQAVGGWQGICLSENGAADRARFLEAYDLLLKREVRRLQQMPAVRELLADGWDADESGRERRMIDGTRARAD